MNKVLNKNFILLFCCITFFSCKKDKPIENNQAFDTELSKGVYICNEGNFMFGNSQLSFYNKSNDSLIQNLFEVKNSSKLGDVFQSMCFFNNNAYLIINNSQKIIIADSTTFNKTGEITGLTSPRYFLPVNSSKAYVSDLYANALSVIDIDLNIVSKTIPIKGWTEELILIDDNAFVTNRTSDMLYVIDIHLDTIKDSLQIGYGANSIQKDINGKLWTLCEGNATNNNYASLCRINPKNMTVEQIFQFNQLSESPKSLKISGGGDTLYYLNSDLYQMGINETSLPNQFLISGDDKTFYGLGIDPHNGDIYVSDAIDYVQRGKVYRYSNTGNLKNAFLSGIIPGNIYFN